MPSPGATDRRIGRFELADQGTLFMDEVGDLGAEAQAKLLRAIEAKEIERVGGGKPIPVNVRIVAATNKDLEKNVADGTFREDLYFRLNVIPMQLPPLRDRADDIDALVLHFSALGRARGYPAPRWTPGALELMRRYRWPGNVRELANIVERLGILHAGAERHRHGCGRGARARSHAPAHERLAARGHRQATRRRARRLRAGADHRTRSTAANGNVAEAARRLRTDRPNLYRRMRRLSIEWNGHVMRARRCAWIVAAALLAGASLVSRARAQARDSTPARDTVSDSLSYDDAAEIAYLFNAVAAIRNTGPTTIAAGDSVAGNVAVLWGPLTIAGKVHGSVVVVNGSVTIVPGGHIDSDLIVTGGTAMGVDSTTVSGDVQVHRDALRFHQSGDLIIAESPEGAEIADASWFKHWLHRHVRPHNGFVLVGGPYNRVEGLPIIGGPAIRRTIGIGTLRLSALGIYRSADHFAWKGENLGWHASSELAVGGARNLRFGIEGYDIVRPTDSWQLKDGEVSLASFFLHRDYRDYYNTKGGHAWVTASAGRKLSLELGVRNERWEPRETRDPFTLLRNGSNWRPNPTLDDRAALDRRGALPFRHAKQRR